MYRIIEIDSVRYEISESQRVAKMFRMDEYSTQSELVILSNVVHDGISYPVKSIDYYACYDNCQLICKAAMELGAVHEIPNDQLKKLMDLRKKMNLPGRHPGIDYGDEPTTSCNCSKDELVEAITRKVLAALGK